MQNATITFPLLGEAFALNPPRYFAIFGFNIHFYGLFLGLGALLGALYALRRSKDFDLTQDHVLNFILFCVPMAVVFSRLYYVAFNLERYLHDPLLIITGIRSGGLTIYGVVFGGLFGVWLCSRIMKQSLLDFIDLASPALLIGQVVGRWGNFINRELFGRETMLPWRMGLTAGGETLYVHPTFLYEALWNAVGLILLHRYSKQPGRMFRGQLFTLYLGWYGLGRIWVEALRDPNQNMFLGPIPINMAIAIACVLAAVGINYMAIRRQKKQEAA